MYSDHNKEDSFHRIMSTLGVVLLFILYRLFAKTEKKSVRYYILQICLHNLTDTRYVLSQVDAYEQVAL